MIAEIDFFRLLADVGIRTDVETDDDGVRGVGQHDVGVDDATGGAVDDADADLVVREFLEALLDGLDGTLDVGFDDDVEVFELALFEGSEQVVERDLLLRVELLFLDGLLSLLDQFTGQFLVSRSSSW